MGGMAPPINETVNFLNKFSPAAIERLRDSLPSEIVPLLKPGGLAGKTDPLLEPRVLICIAALEEVIPRCEDGIQICGTRLRRARRMSLAAGIAAMVGSSSVLATLAAQSTVVTAASGVLALAGSALTFLADFTTRPDYDAKNTLFDIYVQLSRGRFRAEQLRGELNVHVAAGLTSKREPVVIQLIGEVNALCLDVNDRLASILI